MADRADIDAPGKIMSSDPVAVLKPMRKRRQSHHSRQPRWLRKLRKQVARLPLRRLVFMLIGVAAVVAVVSFAVVSDAQTRVTTSLNSLNRVLATISGKPGTELTLEDFDRLRASVNDLARTFANADRQTTLLRPLAPLSQDAKTQLDALDIGQELVLAGQDMLTGIEPTLFYLVGGEEGDNIVSQISSGERVVELLGLGRGRFLSAAAHLDNARTQLQSLDIGSAAPDVILTVEQLTDTHEQLQAAKDVLLNAPTLLTTALGLTDEQTYLVLAQNSDELRPSGGYLSTYGWMVMRNGRIVAYDYSATTTTSPNPPPASAELPFEIPDWWLRFREPVYAAWDGSWSPDFPSTADRAIWYYNTGNNPHAPVTGAIAIDIVGFELILEALGPVSVPDYHVTVSRADFRDVIYDIRTSGQGAHKEFLAALYRQIFDEWQSVDDVDTNSALLGAMLQGLQEKHIMLHFADPTLNAPMEVLGWSGSQASGAENDYLMVVDANLGNKSNRSVIRQVTYDTEIDASGTANSRVTVAYDYPAALADNDPAVDPEHHGPIDYRTLLQVMAPVGSTDVTAANQAAPARVVSEANHTLIVTQLTVPYDTAARVQYSYVTPDIVEAYGPYQRYRLHIDKQPGMLAESVSIQISLPPEAIPLSINPAPATSYDIDRPILEFRLQTTTDEWIEITYRMPVETDEATLAVD